MYQTRAYDNDAGDPVAVLVVTGTHDVSRLINLLAGSPANIEQLQTGRTLLKQVRAHSAGRAALKLLAAHGGPDFTPADTTIAIPEKADSVGKRYRLGHGGAYCAHCRKAMREGTPVVRTTAPLCLSCAPSAAPQQSEHDASDPETKHESAGT